MGFYNVVILKIIVVGDFIWFKSYFGGYGIFIVENIDGIFFFVIDEYVNVIDIEGEVISIIGILFINSFDFNFIVD